MRVWVVRMARYDSFLLRIWRSGGERGPQWAIRLENVQHGDQTHFASLDALLAHLRAIAGPLAATQVEAGNDGTSEAEHSDRGFASETDSTR